MSFTLYTDPYHPSEIDPKQLKHHYFVQLTPDRKNLVPGMLQQSQPEGNTWLDVTKVDRDFPKRYFVQYTNFNTLVPGSLVQENKLPEGRWKEVKRPRRKFHKVVFSNPYNLVFATDVPNSTVQYFTLQDNFNINRVIPIFNLLYPDAPRDHVNDMAIGPLINYIPYYFKGNFADLKSDPSKLIAFGQPNNFGISAVANGVGAFGPLTVSAGYRSPEMYLYGLTYLPDGTYSIIIGVLDAAHEIKEYLVFENLVIKSTSTGLPPILGL
jgi:hypothetical protein